MSLQAAWHIIVLAAGKGTRMRSNLPKVLHPIGGKSMLARVVETAQSLHPRTITVVVGFGAEAIRAAMPEAPVRFAWQTEQRGTGHAVACGLHGLAGADEDRVLVLYGDVPLISQVVLQSVLQQASQASVTILTTELDDPTGYGRIVRGHDQAVIAIREQRDCLPAEAAIREINTGILAARLGDLRRWLPALTPHNAQGELYLTDIVSAAVAESRPVNTVCTADTHSVAGVNDRWALAALERVYQRRQAEALALAGVTLADPARIDFRGEVTAGIDCMVDVNVVFEGAVTLGNGVIIEPNCILKDVELGDGVRVRAFSHLEGAVLQAGAEVGPYARLRPGTELGAHSKIGNFVEIKASQIGEGSKVNHLSYVGDTKMGAECNIGAGTITCNYDGANKHRTEIGDRVFVGSSSQLVAPVRVEDDATIGAGSTITQAVPAGTLALARARQVIKTGWQRPRKKPKTDG
ncbi:bifunctional UDP-N-acetylglucosamine diphosphorylase/glucosamine-1-phosphate N-acetyltransferase GlmU [Halothiobacillus sp. DCM-1]|uniref:bifunctional UDP-N-acetylglucosamine diphosphorylase/glucosamine-1-phosphate N-acetyltransferase GlmU n=1 Tax=Halothiobacillus sp. DCM-1 TaxID=3112558 RepID=UPI0032444085